MASDATAPPLNSTVRQGKCLKGNCCGAHKIMQPTLVLRAADGVRQALCMDTDQMVQKVLEELRENATASEGGSIYDERDRALQDILRR